MNDDGHQQLDNDRIISLLTEYKPYALHLKFWINGEIPVVNMELEDERRMRMHCTGHALSNDRAWERIGLSIGRNTSLMELKMRRVNEVDEVDEVSPEARRCFEALYRGLAQSTVIKDLEIDPDLFPEDGDLPPLNLEGSPLGKSLRSIKLNGYDPLPIDFTQSVVLSSIVEHTSSLEQLDLTCIKVDFAHEEHFNRIISKCQNVKSLHVRCRSVALCPAVAELVERSSSIRHLVLYGGVRGVSEEGLSIVAAGLAKNTTLKLLTLAYRGSWSAISKILCDTSSIESIHSSNHTLEAIDNRGNIPPVIKECLDLNRNPNKKEVIRMKIFRYYFVGDFEVAPFAQMPVSVLPQVLGMIQCSDDKDRRLALFRFARYIPDFCNASSRVRRNRHSEDEEMIGAEEMDDGNKRQKKDEEMTNAEEMGDNKKRQKLSAVQNETL